MTKYRAPETEEEEMAELLMETDGVTEETLQYAEWYRRYHGAPLGSSTPKNVLKDKPKKTK